MYTEKIRIPIELYPKKTHLTIVVHASVSQIGRKIMLNSKQIRIKMKKVFKSFLPSNHNIFSAFQLHLP